MAKKKPAKPIGRPKSKDPKVPVNARVLRSERDAAQQRAESAGLSWSEFVRAALHAYKPRRGRPPKS